MSHKKSKIETIKNFFCVVAAIAGPMCAGLSWLAGLMAKMRRGGKASQTMTKNWEEKSGMLENILKFVAGIAVIAGVGGGVYVLIQKVREWFADRSEQVTNISAISPPKAEIKPGPTVSYQTLFAKKRELEQRMASVTGGETGLFMLREMMHDAASKGMLDIQYREAYRMKQDKLRGYLKDYQELLKQVEGAPEEERGRFKPEEGIDRYQELLDEKV